MSEKKIYGTGRRKNSIARVFMESGKGDIKVNGKPFRDYLCRETLATIVLQPLSAVECEKGPCGAVSVKSCRGAVSPSSSHRPSHHVVQSAVTFEGRCDGRCEGRCEAGGIRES